MTLTRRQALAGFLTTAAGLLVPEPRRVYSFATPALTWQHLIEADRAMWEYFRRQWSISAKRQLIAACHARDRMLAERPAVQLSTYSTPQENQDRNHIDEACGTKSVQIDPTGY